MLPVSCLFGHSFMEKITDVNVWVEVMAERGRCDVLELYN